MKTISIGLISYNEEKNIINILNSVSSKFLGDFILKEIVISDDSNDKTPYLINEFIKENSHLQIKLFHHSERRGASAGWNELFKETSGDFLVLYDSDVILEEKTTYNLVKSFGLDIGLCASNPQSLEYPSIYGRASKFITYWLKRVRETELTQFTVMGRGLAIKSDLAKKITIPKDIIAIDYFLQIKIIEFNQKVLYVNNAILYFKPPQNLNDFLSQVIRADKGHKQLSFYKTKKLSLISNITITLKSFITDPFGGLATLYCYCFIPYYKLRNQNEISSKWEIAQSTKA
jgi:glycosyltransferase involved in cell wall biosynthesis